MSSDLEMLWSPVWHKNPALKELMVSWGEKSVYEYAASFLTPFDGGAKERQDEWLTVFSELLEVRLGKDVAQAVAQQLRELPLVSTADHHAPLDEPYWVNTNLVHSLAQAQAGNKYCVALSFASISLNTALGYPRGLLMHDNRASTDGLAPHYRFYPEEKLLKFSYFGDKDKMSTVYGFRAFQKEEFDRLLAAIQLKTKEGSVSSEHSAQLKTWSETFFLDPELLRQKDYASQITVLNYKLWPHFFDGSVPSEAPRVVHFEIETLVGELLKRVHFKDVESPLYKLMFSPQGRAAFVDAFEGIHGAFCAHENDGTYFFWGFDAKGHRVRLFLKDDCLHSETKEICIPLDPRSFAEALDSKKIFPSMALCYVMMAFYYRLRCMGGSSQIKDLTATKNAWMKVLNTLGFEQEAVEISGLPTQDLVGSIALSMTQTPSGDRVLPTGIDLLLNTQKMSIDDYKKRAQNTTLKSALLPYLKDLYNDYCREIPFPLQDLDLKLD